MGNKHTRRQSQEKKKARAAANAASFVENSETSDSETPGVDLPTPQADDSTGNFAASDLSSSGAPALDSAPEELTIPSPEPPPPRKSKPAAPNPAKPEEVSLPHPAADQLEAEDLASRLFVNNMIAGDHQRIHYKTGALLNPGDPGYKDPEARKPKRKANRVTLLNSFADVAVKATAPEGATRKQNASLKRKVVESVSERPEVESAVSPKTNLFDNSGKKVGNIPDSALDPNRSALPAPVSNPPKSRSIQNVAPSDDLFNQIQSKIAARQGETSLEDWSARKGRTAEERGYYTVSRAVDSNDRPVIRVSRQESVQGGADFYDISAMDIGDENPVYAVNNAFSPSRGFVIGRRARRGKDGKYELVSAEQQILDTIGGHTGITGMLAGIAQSESYDNMTQQNLSDMANALYISDEEAMKNKDGSVNYALTRAKATEDLGIEFGSREEGNRSQDLTNLIENMAVTTERDGEIYVHDAQNAKRTRLISGIYTSAVPTDKDGNRQEAHRRSVKMAETDRPDEYLRRVAVRSNDIRVLEGQALLADVGQIFTQKSTHFIPLASEDAELPFQEDELFNFRGRGEKVKEIPGLPGAGARNYHNARVTNIGDFVTAADGRTGRYVDVDYGLRDVNTKYSGLKAFNTYIPEQDMVAGADAITVFGSDKDMGMRMIDLMISDAEQNAIQNGRAGYSGVLDAFVKHSELFRDSKRAMRDVFDLEGVPTNNVARGKPSPRAKDIANFVKSGGQLKLSQAAIESAGDVAISYFRNRWTMGQQLVSGVSESRVEKYKDAYFLSQEARDAYENEGAESALFKSEIEKFRSIYGDSVADRLASNPNMRQLESATKRDDGMYDVRENFLQLMAYEGARYRPEYHKGYREWSNEEMERMRNVNPAMYDSIMNYAESYNVRNSSLAVINAANQNEEVGVLQNDNMTIDDVLGIYQSNFDKFSKETVEGSSVLKYSQEEAKLKAIESISNEHGGAFDRQLWHEGQIVAPMRDLVAFSHVDDNDEPVNEMTQSLIDFFTHADEADKLSDSPELYEQSVALRDEAFSRLVSMQDAQANTAGTIDSAMAIRTSVFDGAQEGSALLKENEVAINREDWISKLKEMGLDKEHVAELVRQYDEGTALAPATMYPHTDPEKSMPFMKVVDPSKRNIKVQAGKSVFNETVVESFTKDFDADFGFVIPYMGERDEDGNLTFKAVATSEEEIREAALLSPGAENKKSTEKVTRSPVKFMQDALRKFKQGVPLRELIESFHEEAANKPGMGVSYNMGVREEYGIGLVSSARAAASGGITNAHFNRIKKALGQVASRIYQPFLDNDSRKRDTVVQGHNLKRVEERDEAQQVIAEIRASGKMPMAGNEKTRKGAWSFSGFDRYEDDTKDPSLGGQYTFPGQKKPTGNGYDGNVFSRDVSDAIFSKAVTRFMAGGETDQESVESYGEFAGKYATTLLRPSQSASEENLSEAADLLRSIQIDYLEATAHENPEEQRKRRRNWNYTADDAYTGTHEERLAKKAKVERLLELTGAVDTPDWLLGASTDASGEDAAPLAAAIAGDLAYNTANRKIPYTDESEVPIGARRTTFVDAEGKPQKAYLANVGDDGQITSPGSFAGYGRIFGPLTNIVRGAARDLQNLSRDAKGTQRGLLSTVFAKMREIRQFSSSDSSSESPFGQAFSHALRMFDRFSDRASDPDTIPEDSGPIQVAEDWDINPNLSVTPQEEGFPRNSSPELSRAYANAAGQDDDPSASSASAPSPSDWGFDPEQDFGEYSASSENAYIAKYLLRPFMSKRGPSEGGNPGRRRVDRDERNRSLFDYFRRAGIFSDSDEKIVFTSESSGQGEAFEAELGEREGFKREGLVKGQFITASDYGGSKGVVDFIRPMDNGKNAVIDAKKYSRANRKKLLFSGSRVNAQLGIYMSELSKSDDNLDTDFGYIALGGDTDSYNELFGEKGVFSNSYESFYSNWAMFHSTRSDNPFAFASNTNYEELSDEDRAEFERQSYTREEFESMAQRSREATEELNVPTIAVPASKIARDIERRSGAVNKIASVANTLSGAQPVRRVVNWVRNVMTSGSRKPMSQGRKKKKTTAANVALATPEESPPPIQQATPEDAVSPVSRQFSPDDEGPPPIDREDLMPASGGSGGGKPPIDLPPIPFEDPLPPEDPGKPVPPESYNRPIPSAEAPPDQPIPEPPAAKRHPVESVIVKFESNPSHRDISLGMERMDRVIELYNRFVKNDPDDKLTPEEIEELDKGLEVVKKGHKSKVKFKDGEHGIVDANKVYKKFEQISSSPDFEDTNSRITVEASRNKNLAARAKGDNKVSLAKATSAFELVASHTPESIDNLINIAENAEDPYHRQAAITQLREISQSYNTVVRSSHGANLLLKGNGDSNLPDGMDTAIYRATRAVESSELSTQTPKTANNVSPGRKEKNEEAIKQMDSPKVDLSDLIAQLKDVSRAAEESSKHLAGVTTETYEASSAFVKSFDSVSEIMQSTLAELEVSGNENELTQDQKALLGADTTSEARALFEERKAKRNLLAENMSDIRASSRRNAMTVSAEERRRVSEERFNEREDDVVHLIDIVNDQDASESSRASAYKALSDIVKPLERSRGKPNSIEIFQSASSALAENQEALAGKAPSYRNNYDDLDAIDQARSRRMTQSITGENMSDTEDALKRLASNDGWITDKDAKLIADYADNFRKSVDVIKDTLESNYGTLSDDAPIQERHQDVLGKSKNVGEARAFLERSKALAVEAEEKRDEARAAGVQIISTNPEVLNAQKMQALFATGLSGATSRERAFDRNSGFFYKTLSPDEQDPFVNFMGMDIKGENALRAFGAAGRFSRGLTDPMNQFSANIIKKYTADDAMSSAKEYSNVQQQIGRGQLSIGAVGYEEFLNGPRKNINDMELRAYNNRQGLGRVAMESWSPAVNFGFKGDNQGNDALSYLRGVVMPSVGAGAIAGLYGSAISPTAGVAMGLTTGFGALATGTFNYASAASRDQYAVGSYLRSAPGAGKVFQNFRGATGFLTNFAFGNSEANQNSMYYSSDADAIRGMTVEEAMAWQEQVQQSSAEYSSLMPGYSEYRASIEDLDLYNKRLVSQNRSLEFSSLAASMSIGETEADLQARSSRFSMLSGASRDDFAAPSQEEAFRQVEFEAMYGSEYLSTELGIMSNLGGIRNQDRDTISQNIIREGLAADNSYVYSQDRSYAVSLVDSLQRLSNTSDNNTGVLNNLPDFHRIDFVGDTKKLYEDLGLDFYDANQTAAADSLFYRGEELWKQSPDTELLNRSFFDRSMELLIDKDYAGMMRVERDDAASRSLSSSMYLTSSQSNEDIESAAMAISNNSASDRSRDISMSLALGDRWNLSRFASALADTSGKSIADYQTIDTQTGLGSWVQGTSDAEDAFLRAGDTYGLYSRRDNEVGWGQRDYQNAQRTESIRMRDYSREFEVSQREGGFQLQTGSTSAKDIKLNADGSLAVDFGEDSFSKFDELFSKYGLGTFQSGNGMTAWQIDDRQYAMSRQKAELSLRQSQEGMGDQLEGFELARRQFYENYEFGKQKMEYGQAYQEQSMGISRERQLLQEGYTREDMSFQKSQSDLNYAWQTEDLDRNLRYARGRERRDLMRQKERAAVSYSMQSSRQEVEKDRFEESSEFNTRQYERERSNFEQNKQFAIQDMEMNRRHWEEKRALDQKSMDRSVEMHQLEIQQQTESFQLQDQQRLLDRQNSLLQMEMGTQHSEILYQNQLYTQHISDMLTLITQRAEDQSAAIDAATRNGVLMNEVAASQIAKSSTEVLRQISEETVRASARSAQSFSQMFREIATGQQSLGKSVSNYFQQVSQSQSGFLSNFAGRYNEALGAVATIGANSLASSFSGILGKLRGLTGFATGGYTGDGGVLEPAGIVHAGEYVVPKGGSLVLNSQDQIDRLDKIASLLQKIVDMGPGRVNATINTTTKSLNTGDLLDAIYRS